MSEINYIISVVILEQITDILKEKAIRLERELELVNQKIKILNNFEWW